MTESYPTGPRNQVRQIRRKARYDRDTVHRILDCAFTAQVGFVQGLDPVVMPMIYGRDGETLFLHGARKSRIIKILSDNPRVCINVTLVDGIVAARSAFNSSLNYRSVNVFGSARLVEDPDENLNALQKITEQIIPGRWEELRPPQSRELKQTGVIAVTIEDASAKVSDAGPDDEEEDYTLAVWAGVIPMPQIYGNPIDDQRLLDGVSVSSSIRNLIGSKPRNP